MSVLKGGTLFAGRYVVVGHLASGGMGAVYEVTHTETDRRCALKVMQPHIMDEDGLRQRFKLEAKVAAQIDSDAVVQVFDAGVDAATGSPFLVMELLKGEDLAARVARLGRLSAKEVVSLLWQIAVALDKIHGAGVVHRDLKPENLFVVMRKDGKPQLKILDFGIAKAHVETASQQQGTLSIGTPMYMAPEQFDGKAVSGQTDTFSLALVAFTLLVGQPYWMEEASSAGVIAFAIKASSGLVEPACSRAARVGVELPAAFDAWFAKATARAPHERFSSASAMVTALAQALGVDPETLPGFDAETNRVANNDTIPIDAADRPIAASAGRKESPTNPAKTVEAQPRKSAVFYGLAGLAVMAALLGLAYAFYTIGAWRAAEQAPKADNTVIITARSETTQPPTSQPAPTTDAPVKSVNVTTAGPSASASSPPSSYPFTTAQTPGRGWIQSVACPVTDDGKDCVPCCNYPGDILTKPPACQCYTKTPYRN